MPNTLRKELNNKDVQVNQLTIDAGFYDFVNSSVLPQIQLPQEVFWREVESIFERFIPVNKQLLEKRSALQAQINEYHLNAGSTDVASYKSFLQDINYLVKPPAPFKIESTNVDDEIATMAGPQLVVPVMNARYALNAVNARWGSLYDALYGTDVISEENGAEKGKAYNPVRGDLVIQYARTLLNTHCPINDCWTNVSRFNVENEQLVITLENGETSHLAEPSQFVGYQGKSDQPTGIVLAHNNLHLIVQIDADHPVGKTDKAYIKDVLVESALTTIMDCEDSVAAVDAEDKIAVYKNWLGLMSGELTEDISKNGQVFQRKMNGDIEFISKDGFQHSLSGRALMFVRNVGHLMTNPVMQFNGEDVPEGILDGIITAAIGKIDVQKPATATIKNSQKGSIYIVKPKMHGPEEVAFTQQLFDAVEDALSLDRYTLKMGIMDEERRTSVNLRACIKEAKERVVFINTGFLDRTGDEIHTSMLAGPFMPKAILKTMPWIYSYEESNVASGLNSGFLGKAQIGKGMWPIPDNMADMMEAKIGHPQAGANTAWVPSPTAATLHALHYHQVSVPSIQDSLIAQSSESELLTDEAKRLESILTIPLLSKDEPLTPGKVNHELDNNAQGILGYVVRWVDAGIGCSKVPDINNVGLMEDRATCRISSQHMANWLTHGLCSEQRIVVVMKKMAAIVDQQNVDVEGYEPMGPDFDNSIAFNAALDLVLKGKDQPSGYTEPLLHAARLAKKASLQN
ncbi:malate synthase G [Psychrosphaera haliotis]|uniref:Malate synthase G n=1 Tax=Psychrosphaera haliotis TaxID=555083 RepID=A0A6N8FA32_9GAMM|nr:malate synthase G [Psychrosphaera haliotis]MUH73158.1 malate synthase G [Psychrosphaera haliotis]